MERRWRHWGCSTWICLTNALHCTGFKRTLAHLEVTQRKSLWLENQRVQSRSAST
ncbi:hypothetical protein BDP81DRAFT_429808 [Colletotrichum phormii]|uniref:Uncharacterized protein n=1 Tax=Colletotrichum phormii TaxID=359342 RepID=A0AAI9ZRV6_9PEZI|nr:uncharacterized protein BDP81DRAFT_429808 [Colletotrichum phormii]KAK1635522.1 hypothetical protein BDP81DRAFT_429808 [Colletotrichum phormii]